MSPALRAGLALAAVTAASLGAGCSTALVRVQPWQRGTLADVAMNPARDPIRAAQLDHVYFSREAADGGRGVGGSGCGCN